MNKLKISVGNIVRDMTEEEIAQYELDQITIANEKAKETEAIAKRAAAEAKLEALGLTPADLKALGL